MSQLIRLEGKHTVQNCGKLMHQRSISANWKEFQCILRGVRLLLANCSEFSATSETLSYIHRICVHCIQSLYFSTHFQPCQISEAIQFYFKFEIKIDRFIVTDKWECRMVQLSTLNTFVILAFANSFLNFVPDLAFIKIEELYCH